MEYRSPEVDPQVYGQLNFDSFQSISMGKRYLFSKQPFNNWITIKIFFPYVLLVSQLVLFNKRHINKRKIRLLKCISCVHGKSSQISNSKVQLELRFIQLNKGTINFLRYDRTKQKDLESLRVANCGKANASAGCCIEASGAISRLVRVVFRREGRRIPL